MQSKKIKLNDKEYEVQTATVENVAVALGFIDELAEPLSNIEIDKDNQVKMVGTVAKLLSTSSKELFAILGALSGLTAEEIGKLGIADLVALINAMIEVNDISSIKKEFGEIKKVFQKATEQEAVEKKAE